MLRILPLTDPGSVPAATVARRHVMIVSAVAATLGLAVVAVHGRPGPIPGPTAAPAGVDTITTPAATLAAPPAAPASALAVPDAASALAPALVPAPAADAPASQGPAEPPVERAELPPATAVAAADDAAAPAPGELAGEPAEAGEAPVGTATAVVNEGDEPVAPAEAAEAATPAEESAPPSFTASVDAMPAPLAEALRAADPPDESGGATPADPTGTQGRLRLAEADVTRYRAIFAAQALGDWSSADALIAQLGDHRLQGQVQLQRYLHPSAYRASYAELRTWLKSYGDQAGAERVLALAQRRQAAGDPPPPDLPAVERLRGELETRAAWRDASDLGRETPVSPRQRTPVTSPQARALAERIDGLIKADKARAALGVFNDDPRTTRLNDLAFDRLRAQVAEALFYDGAPKAALTLAGASAERSGDRVPTARWITGLAAWRLGQPERAAREFAALARTGGQTPLQLSGAAFWAGRAYERLGREAEARLWFQRAAGFPRTFYGLIARRHLGLEISFHWQVPPLSPRHVAAIAANPAGRRAVALLQVGQTDLAEQELRRIHPRHDGALAEALVALADAAGMPGLALQVGSAVPTPEGDTYDACLYPLPHWTPRNGFTIDRALMFGIMRQESRFEARSVSGAGATGVMQLMPETAHDLGAARGDDGHPAPGLFEPELNLALAQRYLHQLLEMPEVGRDLILMAAAYNAGPANLIRWRRDPALRDDPLLFVESLPYRETRHFVRKVMANLWIYRLRLNQSLSSLDALASGQWPAYLPADPDLTQVADNGVSH